MARVRIVAKRTNAGPAPSPKNLRMKEPNGESPAHEQIQRLQESIAFLERRLDEYASVTDDLAAQFGRALKRIGALESGATSLRSRVDELAQGDQSGPGQPA